jgi:hypothetical protein
MSRRLYARYGRLFLPRTSNGWWCSLRRGAPFDAENEYILPEFGLRPKAFYRRLLKLAETSPTLGLERSDRSRLASLCRSKLVQFDATSTQGS